MATVSGRPRGGPGTSLDEIDRILVDGNNLLHRTAGTAAGAAPRLLLARMAAAIPTTIDTVLVLDGQPDAGSPSRMRIRRGLEVRHSGRVDADGVLVYLVESQPFVDRARTIVVSDDRGLVERVRTAGGHTRRLDWFQRLLDAGPAVPRSGSAAGNAPPTRRGRDHGPGDPRLGEPRVSQGGARRRGDRGADLEVGDARVGDDGDPGDDRPGWQPGRGATRKRGNPKRNPRRPG